MSLTKMPPTLWTQGQRQRMSLTIQFLMVLRVIRQPSLLRSLVWMMILRRSMIRMPSMKMQRSLEVQIRATTSTAMTQILIPTLLLLLPQLEKAAVRGLVMPARLDQG